MKRFLSTLLLLAGSLSAYEAFQSSRLDKLYEDMDRTAENVYRHDQIAVQRQILQELQRQNNYNGYPY